MKKFLPFLFVCITLFATYQANAQYCGSSQAALGYGNCTFRSNFGFGNVDSFPCITRGQCDSLIIPFKVFTGFTAQGNTITIYKLRFDAIDSLPCGLCWSTNQSATPGNGVNEFSPGENGCIKIIGQTNDPAGSYRLHMSLAVRDQPTTTNGYDIDTIASDAGGITLWVKVVDAGNNCPMQVDTAHPQHASNCGHIGCSNGIREIATVITDLSIQPNPMNNEAKVTFTSQAAGAQQVKITNIVGSEVYRSTVTTKLGTNEMTISRNGLPAGIYILSIGGSQGTTSRKFIISE
jgi:Secretion system C-terminal sorting domain